MLAALKAFSMWSLGKVVAEYLDGVCASGIYEARLGREEYGGEIATYCAGYKAEDLPAIIKASDHVIFNSPAQIARFRPQIDAARRMGKRSEEHTSELQSLMRISYAVFCWKKKKQRRRRIT